MAKASPDRSNRAAMISRLLAYFSSYVPAER